MPLHAPPILCRNALTSYNMFHLETSMYQIWGLPPRSYSSVGSDTYSADPSPHFAKCLPKLTDLRALSRCITHSFVCTFFHVSQAGTMLWVPDDASRQETSYRPRRIIAYSTRATSYGLTSIDLK